MKLTHDCSLISVAEAPAGAVLFFPERSEWGLKVAQPSDVERAGPDNQVFMLTGESPRRVRNMNEAIALRATPIVEIDFSGGHKDFRDFDAPRDVTGCVIVHRGGRALLIARDPRTVGLISLETFELRAVSYFEIVGMVFTQWRVGVDVGGKIDWLPVSPAAATGDGARQA